MLIEFSLANYKSFHSLQTLSFRATGLTSDVDEKNLIEQDDRNKILKIVGIYGPNASGKSNLIKGLGFFQEMVDQSLETDNVAQYAYNPYRLSDKKEEHYGYFQVVIVLEDKKYRYGFTLASDCTIQKEWLFGPAQKNETYYFKRTGNMIEKNPEYFQEGFQLPDNKLRNDTLFLTFCTSYNGPISKAVKEYIANKIYLDSSSYTSLKKAMYRPFFYNAREITDRLVEKGQKQIVLNWLKEAGLSIKDITLETKEVVKNIRANQVKFHKDVLDENGKLVGSSVMDLDTDESEGTKKFYAYIGDLHKLFLEGGIFVCDEIDSNFHPSLLRRLICLFQEKQFNRAQAQLLFTSHDTNLMSPDLMRRDQFYFTEKTVYDETRLYSLADLKGIRNNADFARQYLSGYYGALPQLGRLLDDTNTHSIENL